MIEYDDMMMMNDMIWMNKWWYNDGWINVMNDE